MRMVWFLGSRESQPKIFGGRHPGIAVPECALSASAGRASTFVVVYHTFDSVLHDFGAEVEKETNAQVRQAQISEELFRMHRRHVLN